ncbi:succinic semialdehyde dehydrogenase [Austwickia sp. TVS 96-490-7B]|uniref:succinic semialdehyde dehydrogenase n=1 Tax=Austwickia sp. TVS 96-490-7B TaxID=2830843 RepID=UPI001C598662|nr:succinic semialdehyde dehydrogenase [Austwickia sp. TVS 96-490-7B]
MTATSGLDLHEDLQEFPHIDPATGQSPLDPAVIRRLTGLAITSPRAQTHTAVTPMSGRALAQIPLSTPEDVRVAVDGARAVQPSWAMLPIEARAEIMLRFHDLVLAHQVELLDLIQLESGKSRLHAFEEIVDVCQVSRYYARTTAQHLAPRKHTGIIPGLTEVTELHHPKGVVGIVAPWNYPLSMGITDVIPALMAGNGVVVRPDMQTSLTLLYCADLFRQAGLPSRVLQVVLGRGGVVGSAIFDLVDYIQFTGSTKTGRAVAQQAGERLVSCSLELGGKNPMYVAADAPLRRAVEGAVQACFASAGQLCVSIERLILHEDIADEFLAAFIPAVQAVRVGTALTYDADMGSLVSAEQLATVQRHVEDARAKGATVLAGGRHRPDLGPWCYEPTVLDGVTEDMTVCREETFGPVVSVYRVASDEEAVRVANDTEYGLNASVWTRDLVRGRRIAASIEAGTVNVNEGYAAAYGSTHAPMGGFKASGMGRRHGAEGVMKYTETQTVAVQRLQGLGVPRPLTSRQFTGVMTGFFRVMKALGRP